MERPSIAAAQGLHKVLLGEILLMAALLLYGVAQLLLLLPMMYLGSLVNLAGFVMILIGLAGAAPAHVCYRSALWCAAANVIVSGTCGVVTAELFQTVLAVCSVGLELVTVFFICRATAGLFVEAGELETAYSSAWIWRVYAGLTVLSLLSNLAIVFFYGSMTSAVLYISYLFLRLAGGTVYLIYLVRSRRILLGIESSERTGSPGGPLGPPGLHAVKKPSAEQAWQSSVFRRRRSQINIRRGHDSQKGRFSWRRGDFFPKNRAPAVRQPSVNEAPEAPRGFRGPMCASARRHGTRRARRLPFTRAAPGRG